jgi:hypothetical protein
LGNRLVQFILTTQASPSEGLTRKIVGLSATTCMEFNDDVARKPSSRRDYLAWAQGQMSGVLLGRPVGIDDSLDFEPPAFGLLGQFEISRRLLRKRRFD